MNMNIVDRIKALCDGKQITIMQLEAKLGISFGKDLVRQCCAV